VKNNSLSFHCSQFIVYKKPPDKFPKVFGQDLLSINSPLRREEGFYFYSLRGGGG
jgi:hypothetical protein